MGIFCFRGNRKHEDKFVDKPPALRSTSLDTLADGYQRPGLSVAVPAGVVAIGPSPSSRTSDDVLKITSAFPNREGLSQLAPQNTDNGSQEKYGFDVIAIHGLGGHPRDTWTYNTSKGQVYWLQDFLPKALPTARVYTYGYDSRIFRSRSTGDIHSYAKGLLDNLSVVRDMPLARRSNAEFQLFTRSPEANYVKQRLRPIVFICHSLGGLVCKEALIIANEKRDRFGSILESTKAIFFFGTPHQGSKIADAILHISSILRPFNCGTTEFIFGSKLMRRELIEDLSAKSKKLDRLQSSFIERASKIPCIVTFREVNKVYSHLVVSRGSATIGVADEDVVPLPRDHLQICRIKDENELAFTKIVQECQKLSLDIAARSRSLSQEEQQCVNSLIESIPVDFINIESDPAKSTCEWILAAPQFCAWRDGLKPLLWISAGSGYGKTTLLSFLNQQLRVQNRSSDQHGDNFKNTFTVCSFFFNNRYKDFANATVLLRCLIWDLVTQRHDLIHHVLENYQASRPWSYTQLWHVFQAILDDPGAGNLCMIIDALNECDEKDTSKFLEGLVARMNERSNCGSRSVKFILSSQPVTSDPVREPEEYGYKMLLDQDKALQKSTAADIRSFALNALLHDRRLLSWNDPNRESKIETLADKVATRAEGSFLWATLVFEKLHQNSYIKLSDVDDFISRTPPEIAGLYSESLSNVDYLHRKDVLKSFHIILAARRPLTTVEFKIAYAMKEEHQTLEALQRTVDVQHHIISYLETQLGHLLRISESGIFLRHSAVKDFLLSHGVLTRFSQQAHLYESFAIDDAFSMSIREAETTLTACCINFLNVQDFDQEIGPQNDMIELFEDDPCGMINLHSAQNTPKAPDSPFLEDQCGKPDSCPPFFKYAASNWAFHYASSDHNDEQSTNRILNILTQTNILTHWSHQFRRSFQIEPNLPDYLDASIVAAYLGQTTITSRLATKNYNHLDWTTALTWASRMGHIDVVKKLIELGVPCMGALVGRRSAFSWAVAGGYLKIVDILLACDAGLINIQDADGCSPLILAVGNHDLKMLERLMAQKNIDVNLCSNQGNSALNFAVSGPNPSAKELDIFLRLLDDPRVDITLRNTEGRSCLSYLAEYGATEAIRALLNCSARQEAVDLLLDDKGDARGVSPLSHAVSWHRDNVSTVRLLCETNKIQRQLESVNDLDGDNAFHLAAKNGLAKTIRELGQHYPEGVNSRDRSGRTPLSTAMWGSNSEVLRALLEYGADVNLPSYGGKAAVAYGINKIELVKVLAEHGADMNLRNNNGHTPLSWAKKLDVNEEIVAQLRDLGAHL